jgi:UDP-GlcNAc:undecaprenyl-phosphate GlcNAc-1-phosphate transferase
VIGQPGQPETDALQPELRTPLPTGAPEETATEVSQAFVDRVKTMGEQIETLQAQHRELSEAAGLVAEAPSSLSILHGYIGVFVIAFLVTLIATPIMRRLAVANGIIDRPSDDRKVHRMPVAYLGGVAVFLGLMSAILFSYFAPFVGADALLKFHETSHESSDFLAFAVPPSIVLGMFAIMMVGLLDDVIHISPRIKIAGQLVAAAALAVDDVGVRVAAGIIMPLAHSLTPVTEALGLQFIQLDNFETIGWVVNLSGQQLTIDLVYWAGTAIIAVFVLGACNASNLIDGLDGLLTGTTAIAACGLLVISVGLAVADEGPRDAQRVILCLALLGACLGFLPHNFNPATIFLGDCGSLLLGFVTIVLVLMLGGETGQTHLVVAGLIIYAIPIMDTVLAIVRRKMARRSLSEADSEHLHHMLKRHLGVKGAVFVLYGIGVGFAILGVSLSMGRARIVYVLTMIFAAFIGVTAIKIARRKQIEQDASIGAGIRPAVSGRPSRDHEPDDKPDDESQKPDKAAKPGEPEPPRRAADRAQDVPTSPSRAGAG